MNMHTRRRLQDATLPQATLSGPALSHLALKHSALSHPTTSHSALPHPALSHVATSYPALRLSTSWLASFCLASFRYVTLPLVAFWLASLWLASLGPVPQAAAQPPQVQLKDVTFAELDQAIAAHQGKVVLVDVWATYCAPCRKKFPHFVQLHEKFAKDGLVCISVSTDEETDKAAALEFLVEQQAVFANYRLKEASDDLPSDLKAKYPVDEQPIMFLFNRRGEKIKEFRSKAKPEEIEAAVRKLLEKR